jgi:nucleoside-diphosphate-sugar epimerase
MSKRVLVTGISGYLGSYLTRHLLDSGYEVHGLIRPDSDLTLLGETASRCELHAFGGETSELVEIVGRARPSACFHLASLFRATHATDDVTPLVESNLLLGAQLLEAMVKNGVPDLMNVGTVWQNYKGAAYDPVSLYAATKQGFQDLIRYFTASGTLRAITIKLGDTYGPGDPRRKALPLLLEAARSGEPLAMTAGEQFLDLVHASDVARALEHAAQRLEGEPAPCHLTRCIGSGSPIRLRDLARLVEAELGRSLPIQWGGRAYREREMFEPWSADAPLEGWKPRIPLAEGIREIVSRL